MSKLTAFLRARLAERSSRIQLATLVLLALVVGGVLTVEQITHYADKLMVLVAVLGPLAGVLMPDNNSAIDAAAAQDAAVAAAVALAAQAAEQAAGEGARDVSLAVTRLAEKVGL